MELVKLTPEEIEQVERDHARPHCVIVIFAPLDPNNVFQTVDADMTERATQELKFRADRAKMQIVSTSMSTNVVSLNGTAYSYTKLFCQWAEIEKLEEMQRRAFLAAGGVPPGRRGA